LRSKSSQYNALFNDLDANNLGFLSLKEIEECWKKMFQNNISKKNFVDVFGYEDASKINLEGKLGCLIKKKLKKVLFKSLILLIFTKNFVK